MAETVEILSDEATEGKIVMENPLEMEDYGQEEASQSDSDEEVSTDYFMQSSFCLTHLIIIG